GIRDLTVTGVQTCALPILASYVPSDCLAYIEANDLTQIAVGIEDTEAWKLLAPILGARTSLLPNRWLIRTARWSGIGSINAVLRSEERRVGKECRYVWSTY